MNVAIIGGHGNVGDSSCAKTAIFLTGVVLQVSMRLARLLAARANTKVTSVFRNTAHSDEVAATGATPLVLSLEDEPKETFANVFEGKDVVYFSAGAGGKGGPERTRKVDYEGALKIFDAIEIVKGTKPRLIMVSAIDVRDRSVTPAHYVSIVYYVIHLQHLLLSLLISDPRRLETLRADVEVYWDVHASQI